MERPTISLALIAKNEAPNVKRLLDSVEGCFDEIVFVDTGSTDGTQDIAKSLGVAVYHFDWINDFAAARNYSLDQVKTDYAMWLDLDDVLHNKDAFIDFRNNALKYFDYILANYNYALDANGRPIVTFMRERIFKMSQKPRWNYFVHEGVRPPPNSRIHYCTNWAVNHLRSDEDVVKDKARNLNIFEEHKKRGTLDGRQTFYYGKELFENNQPERAFALLLESITMPIEPHDRILALQYACYAGIQEIQKLKPEYQGEKIMKIIELAQKGTLLQPDRAEFHNIVADLYLMIGRHTHALPFYYAAKGCLSVPLAGDVFSGPIHAMKNLYQEYPRQQIAKILFNMNRRVEAKLELNEAIAKYNAPEAQNMLREMNQIEALDNIESPKTKVEDIVFTCPPQSAYPFDEELYKTKGMGGSETALIEMAKWLRKLTGRPVKVFNMRENPLMSESGVEYISTNHLKEYFSKFEPKVHIAWRHNERVTKASSYLWCHDLMIPGVENGLNQDKVLSLSPFHRDFLASSQGVSRDKILLTRNGISPEKWQGTHPKAKNPNKFVYASSPDRGLDRVLHILDIVREKYPVTLDVYYGLENLYKYGQAELADRLKRMMADRPWVTYHGFTEQKQMYAQCADASIWLHCNDFIETFCITALEMLVGGVYPITRRWGAIGDTLKEAEANGMARMLDIDSITQEQHKIWADECIKAIESKAWEKVQVDPNKFAWKEVAKEWIQMMDLSLSRLAESDYRPQPEITL